MTRPRLVPAPSCTLRPDDHCSEPSACLRCGCVEHIKVKQQLAGFKRRPPAGAPLRSAKR